jgi:hypothetical protein
VEFYWQTQLPVTVAGHTITLTGRRGVATIEAPAECTVRVDALPLLDGAIQQRIAICKPGTSGSLEVVVRLSVR